MPRGVLIAAMILVGVAGEARAQQALESTCVLRAGMSAIVNAGTADYLVSAVDAAEARDCALLVILDTPGGALEATRRIVQSFLQARVPVIVYVAPAGAHAGSAGMFITIAGHVAAMAPATTIGAAHPVLAGGQDPEHVGEQLGRKVVSDVSALARAIASRRGRNADWAESAVRESRSATAQEALELGVVDQLAGSEEELLSALDGHAVQLPDGTVPLRTASARIVPFEMSLEQRVLAVLGDPTVAYLLLMLGLLGLFIELSSPGLGVPGVVGALLLIAAIVGLGLLPIDVGAVALLVLGVGLLVAELFVTSYGLLFVAGLGALIAGSYLLVDPSDARFFADRSVRVSWGAIIPTVVVGLGAAVALVWHVRRTGRQRSPTGLEGLLGRDAVALTEVGPSGGRVRLDGESWAAKSHVPIAAGRTVRVRSVRGLELEVSELRSEYDQRTKDTGI